MECSMCGDVGFQIYLFQCSKCLLRFQHQYCSRTYFDTVSAESISDVCDWCYNTQQEKAGSDINLITDSVKRMRNCVGFGECKRMTHNSKVKRKLIKYCGDINGQIPNELKKQNIPKLIRNNERRVRRKYKLLDEIIC